MQNMLLPSLEDVCVLEGVNSLSETDISVDRSHVLADKMKYKHHKRAFFMKLDAFMNTVSGALNRMDSLLGLHPFQGHDER